MITTRLDTTDLYQRQPCCKYDEKISFLCYPVYKICIIHGQRYRQRYSEDTGNPLDIYKLIYMILYIYFDIKHLTISYDIKNVNKWRHAPGFSPGKVYDICWNLLKKVLLLLHSFSFFLIVLLSSLFLSAPLFSSFLSWVLHLSVPLSTPVVSFLHLPATVHHQLPGEALVYQATTSPAAPPPTFTPQEQAHQGSEEDPPSSASVRRCWSAVVGRTLVTFVTSCIYCNPGAWGGCERLWSEGEQGRRQYRSVVGSCWRCRETGTISVCSLGGERERETTISFVYPCHNEPSPSLFILPRDFIVSRLDSFHCFVFRRVKSRSQQQPRVWSERGAPSCPGSLADGERT